MAALDQFHILCPGLGGAGSSDARPVALVLLNTPAPFANIAFLQAVWRRCPAFRIIADGGASRLFSGPCQSDC